MIVIPAYNEEKTIGDVVRQCKILDTNPTILVVDDGSKDQTGDRAREEGAIVVRHPINRGLGAAISTGLEAALRLGADIIVTLDADGQHDPSEVAALIQPIERGEADVVIGSRFLKVQSEKCKVQSCSSNFKIPTIRKIANAVGNMVTAFLFGIRVTDSQSGFRAFSRHAAERIKIRTNTMEVSSEIIREIKLHSLRLREVPIRAIYTDYSLSKGQGFWKGVETLWKLIVLRFFR